MLQGYQFLDREFTDEDMAEVTRLESEPILLLEQAAEKRPEMDEIVTDLVRLYFARASALEREDIETRRYADALQVYERIVALDPKRFAPGSGWLKFMAVFLVIKRRHLKCIEKYTRLSRTRLS